MTVQTNCRLVELLVLFARLPVDVVTRKAVGIRLSQDRHVADVLQDMAVGRVQRVQVAVAPVDLNITKEIVTGDKVVGERQARAAGLSGSNMALPTHGNDNTGRVSPFVREHRQGRILRVLQRHVSVAGETIDRQ